MLCVLRSNDVIRIAHNKPMSVRILKTFWEVPLSLKKNLQNSFAPGLKFSLDGSERKPKFKLSEIL